MNDGIKIEIKECVFKVNYFHLFRHLVPVKVNKSKAIRVPRSLCQTVTLPIQVVLIVSKYALVYFCFFITFLQVDRDSKI
jgi:hypothetical protein